MGKLELKTSPTSKKRDYSFSDLNIHSGMFKGVKGFDMGQEIVLEVKVKITSLRMADEWESSEYKGIDKNTEFARAQIISVKEKSK